jgi:hypothetical protein
MKEVWNLIPIYQYFLLHLKYLKVNQYKIKNTNLKYLMKNRILKITHKFYDV